MKSWLNRLKVNLKYETCKETAQMFNNIFNLSVTTKSLRHLISHRRMQDICDIKATASSIKENV